MMFARDSGSPSTVRLLKGINFTAKVLEIIGKTIYHTFHLLLCTNFACGRHYKSNFNCRALCIHIDCRIRCFHYIVPRKTMMYTLRNYMHRSDINFVLSAVKVNGKFRLLQ